MKRKRHTEEQIIAILKEHEAGMKTADLCRKRKISEGCFYNLKAKYGGLEVSEAKRLKGLENENAKLDIGSCLMAALLFTCPSTHLKTPIGITRTFKSLRTTWSQKPKLRCPLCGQTHEMRVRDTYIESLDAKRHKWLMSRPSRRSFTNPV